MKRNLINFLFGRLLSSILITILLTNCTINNVTPIPTQIPTIKPTTDPCPLSEVKFWYGYMGQIIDDTTLLYDVADTCVDSSCYIQVAKDFWKFSEEYIDNMGSPPECVSLLHEMIRQNLRDEGAAFFERSKNNFKSSIELRKSVLERMDEIDRLVIPLINGEFGNNLLIEMFNVSKTQTAIPHFIP